MVWRVGSKRKMDKSTAGFGVQWQSEIARQLEESPFFTSLPSALGRLVRPSQRYSPPVTEDPSSSARDYCSFSEGGPAALDSVVFCGGTSAGELAGAINRTMNAKPK
ncbi:hypothetical protein V8C26DRAFT_323430 [Trichoderma gracile]